MKKMTPVRFDQKVVLQVNLITEDEDRTGAYQLAFYQVERILTALDIIATIFLLTIDFLSFVKEDVFDKQNTFTTIWKLGCFRIYVVVLVIWLLVVEASCGRMFYGFRYV